MSTLAMNQQASAPKRIHRHKFALWTACASMIMLFLALTSAYIVRKGQGNWLEFELPSMFYWSTAVIIASSVALQLSYMAFKNKNTTVYRGGMLLAFLLGLVFLVTQYQGWLAMGLMGVALGTNPSGSFIYVISALHALHILGGIGVLSVAMMHAFGLNHRVTSKRKLRFELTLTYWHFVGVLWIYLIGFFILQ